ncbi:MAG TPA: class I SAM-dependent methyltransferase [Rhizomicrobium sp.]|nr:class I SAM-dependent methyltransferase [Rhizomicrobium sp.]
MSSVAMTDRTNNGALSQAARPRGRIGRVFGFLMGRLNKPAYRWTVQQLEPSHPKSMLEIGFGTGHLMAMAAKKLKLSSIAGVDPSELMVETARKRLKRFRRKAEIDIKRGDDTALPAHGPYDAIAALHSFQFWEHPATTLAHIHALLAPQGKFILVLRIHGKSAARQVPNPLSRSGNEVAQAIAAAQAAGFAMKKMAGLSKTSQGLVFAKA